MPNKKFTPNNNNNNRLVGPPRGKSLDGQAPSYSTMQIRTLKLLANVNTENDDNNKVIVGNNVLTNRDSSSWMFDNNSSTSNNSQARIYTFNCSSSSSSSSSSTSTSSTSTYDQRTATGRSNKSWKKQLKFQKLYRDRSQPQVTSVTDPVPSSTTADDNAPAYDGPDLTPVKFRRMHTFTARQNIIMAAAQHVPSKDDLRFRCWHFWSRGAVEAHRHIANVIHVHTRCIR